MNPPTLRPEGYIPRLIDKKVDFAMSVFGAVCIEGPKGCGKTWTARNHAVSEFNIADPRGNFNNLTLAQYDVMAAFEGKEPHLIDEWQECPSIWDATKIMVDQKRTKGRFILTGSSTPVTKGIHHDGTARIGLVRMRPMSLFESGQSTGKVSLKSVFDNEFQPVRTESVSLDDLIGMTVKGGWPSVLGLDVEQSMEFNRSYLESVIRAASRIDGKDRNEMKMRTFVKSLARNESTMVSNRQIVSDMADGDGNDSEGQKERSILTGQTIPSYSDALERIFLIDNQPSFDFNNRSAVRTGKGAKRHLADPSLSISALNLTPEMLKKDLETYGFMFEAMCIRDLRVYADVYGATIYHYRDYSNLEVDAIMQFPDGRYGAFEIKLGDNQTEKAARNLLRFKEYTENANLPQPSALCVINGQSGLAYRRDDGVTVVPVTHLRE